MVAYNSRQHDAESLDDQVDDNNAQGHPLECQKVIKFVVVVHKAQIIFPRWFVLAVAGVRASSKFSFSMRLVDLCCQFEVFDTLEIGPVVFTEQLTLNLWVSQRESRRHCSYNICPKKQETKKNNQHENGQHPIPKNACLLNRLIEPIDVCWFIDYL